MDLHVVIRHEQGLDAASPLFRTNWVLVPNVGLDPLQFDLSGGGEREGGSLPYDVNTSPASELQLRVEFQSVRPSQCFKRRFSGEAGALHDVCDI